MRQYEQAYNQAQRDGIRIKALVLCSPHNPLGWSSRKESFDIHLTHFGPTGRCYSEDVLAEYMVFCNRHKLHLISDEIYALSVWENPALPDSVPFKSILSMDIKSLMDPSMAHVVWGLSKVSTLTSVSLYCDNVAKSHDN